MSSQHLPMASGAARAIIISSALVLAFAATLGTAFEARAATAVATDAFGRTVAVGWGDLDSGQSWFITNGEEANTSVNGSVGRMTHTEFGELKARIPALSLADVDIVAKFRAETPVDDGPAANTEFIIYTRYDGEPHFRYYYRLVLSFVSGSPSPVMRVDRQSINYSPDIAHTSLPVTANDPTAAWMVRFRTVGNSIRGKAWLASQSEPSTWQIDITDSQVTAPNQVGVGTFTNDVTPARTIDVDNVVVTDMSSSPPPPPPPPVPFTDIAGTTFESDIVWLWDSGITKGCTATKYCPDASVTRGQMAAFLVRALGLPPTSTDFFADDNGTTFEGDINRLAASGITKGCGPTSYCPEQEITREQMAAFLDRALKLPATSTDFFTDDEASSFEANINRLAASGVTKGCTPTTYCGLASVTRGQMAAFLHRGLTL